MFFSVGVDYGQHRDTNMDSTIPRVTSCTRDNQSFSIYFLSVDKQSTRDCDLVWNILDGMQAKSKVTHAGNKIDHVYQEPMVVLIQK